VSQAALLGAAKVGQFLLPAVFALGAVGSFVRKIKAGRLVDRHGSNNAPQRDPVTWREFETLVGEIYKRQGYRVAETPEGPDGGVDLVLRRGDERLLVQCKHWQARLVDVKVVRELKGVVAAAGAAGGAVVTSGEFTRDAVDFAKEARIDLIDGRRLKMLAQQLSRSGAVPAGSESKVSPEKPAAEGMSEVPQCPQCSSAMVLRTAKRGSNSGQRFWGCQRYPKCKGTRPAPA
jgi:restriction system protein